MNRVRLLIDLALLKIEELMPTPRKPLDRDRDPHMQQGGCGLSDSDGFLNGRGRRKVVRGKVGYLVRV